MSTILDALRRGRGSQATKPNARPAQTDAVLQTFGYERFSRVSPWTMVLRVFAFLMVAAALAVGVWAAIAWLTLPR